MSFIVLEEITKQINTPMEIKLEEMGKKTWKIWKIKKRMVELQCI